MHYLKGQAVLPPDLLDQIQHYVEGELLYIPKRQANRAKWGSKSGSLNELELRNESILALHEAGKKYQEIAEQYFLSVDRVKKIVLNQKKRQDVLK